MSFFVDCGVGVPEANDPYSPDASRRCAHPAGIRFLMPSMCDHDVSLTTVHPLY